MDYDEILLFRQLAHAFKHLRKEGLLAMQLKEKEKAKETSFFTKLFTDEKKVYFLPHSCAHMNTHYHVHARVQASAHVGAAGEGEGKAKEASFFTKLFTDEKKVTAHTPTHNNSHHATNKREK